jgi:hypothetical protein
MSVLHAQQRAGCINATNARSALLSSHQSFVCVPLLWLFLHPGTTTGMMSAILFKHPRLAGSVSFCPAPSFEIQLLADIDA